MEIYYLGVYEWLMVPSSESAPHLSSPRGPPHIQHSAVAVAASAAHLDAKPGTGRVGVPNRAQLAAQKQEIEIINCISIEKLFHIRGPVLKRILSTYWIRLFNTQN
jgi:hypothetical protein